MICSSFISQPPRGKDLSYYIFFLLQLGNHEVHRVASRMGPLYARAANMLLLTLPGTPICYYGDEIGMVDIEITEESVRDIKAINDMVRCFLSFKPEHFRTYCCSNNKIHNTVIYVYL